MRSSVIAAMLDEHRSECDRLKLEHELTVLRMSELSMTEELEVFERKMRENIAQLDWVEMVDMFGVRLDGMLKEREDRRRIEREWMRWAI